MIMLKKVVILLLTLTLVMLSSGCGGIDVHKNSDDDNLGDNDYLSVDTYKNQTIPIFNAQHQKIASITCYNYSALVNGCVLYTKIPENISSSNCLEYWMYDIAADKSYNLGVVDVRAYRASYELIEHDNHLYLSISLGEFAAQDGNQTIYDIDLSKHTMSPILVIERGSPYNSYTIANDKLIVAEFLYNGDTDIIECNLKEKRTSPIIHKYDESDCFVHDSIRHIYADDKGIYTIRLDWDEPEINYFLYLDTYDFDYNLISTIDIREFCVSTDIERTEDSKINEWKQFVAQFFVHNDLVYYQNFSTTTAIGVMNGDKVDRLLSIDSFFKHAMSLSDDDTSDLFIKSYGDDTDYRNTFYLVNPQTHKIKTAEFFADEILYSFRKAFRDNDKILLSMAYTPYDKGERLPERLYYIDMNDLDFKSMD